jgi:hypothetical protein
VITLDKFLKSGIVVESFQFVLDAAAFLWLHDEDKCRLHLDCPFPEYSPVLGVSLEI